MTTYAHEFAHWMSGREFERPIVPEHLQMFVVSITPSTKVFVRDGVARHYPPAVRFSDTSYACPNHLGVYVAYASRDARLRSVF